MVEMQPAPPAEDSVPERPVPEKLSGMSAFPGMAAGTVLLFTPSDLVIPQFSIEKSAVRGEAQRLRMAVGAVDRQLAALTEAMEEEDAPNEASAIVDVHRAILKDPTFVPETVELIRTHLVNAEWAISLRLEAARREFDQIEDEYIRERFDDIAHVLKHVQRVLAGRRPVSAAEGAEALEDKIILVVDKLDPADMLQLREREDLDIVGLLLEEGSKTSHTVILARSLEIPTLVGVKHARKTLRNGQQVILNADEGVVELSPNAELNRMVRERMRELRREKKTLVKLRDVLSATHDGTDVHLYANIALPEDVALVRKSGAEGIGLFRTEFLFLNRGDLPGEEEQLEAYSQVFRGMRGRPVTIRTADLGGDKALSDSAMKLLAGKVYEEANPALGLRGLRFSFAFPDFFETQLRAILRASLSDVRILLPMVTSPEDVERAREHIGRAMAQLDAEGIPRARSVALGGMIELPSAVTMIRDLIPQLDFFSLGTNDLVQYTLGVDRGNIRVSKYYDELHPAVLRQIGETVRRVAASGKEISVCGEMAGRTDLTEFFIGLGCRSLSMDASRLPGVKERVLEADMDEAEDFASALLRRKTSGETRRAVEARHADFLKARARTAPPS